MKLKLVSKIIDLREMRKSPIDILCLEKTKLDGTYPDSQFSSDGFNILFVKEIEIDMEGVKMVL